jgi:hypothetical protein
VAFCSFVSLTFGVTGSDGLEAAGFWSSPFEMGVSAPMTMSTARIAIATAHHLRHHGVDRGLPVVIAAVFGGAQSPACWGGASSVCSVQATPFQYRIRPGEFGSGYHPAFVVGPVVVITSPRVCARWPVPARRHLKSVLTLMWANADLMNERLDFLAPTGQGLPNIPNDPRRRGKVAMPV